MRHALLLICTCLVWSAFGQTQSNDARYKTGQFNNGRSWQILDENGKTLYLLGFVEAVQLLEGIGASRDVTYPSKLSFGELTQQLDKFYADGANIRIPIALAVPWIKGRVEGKNPETLDKALTTLRQMAQDH